MRKSLFRAGSALQVLTVFGVAAGGTIVATPAVAQDYTSGAINGTITNSNGTSVAGATVTLRSIAQNQVRSFVTNSAGNFSASGVTPGVYEITVQAAGYKPYTDQLTVTAAQESRVTVGLISVTQTSNIIVTGRRLRQTQTQATTGLNVDVAAVNANAPLGHDITSVTLLAPTVQRGVSNFAQANGEPVPTIGGSSVAENAYYINGLNITNPDTYVGSARVPFYFYRSVDVQTGGYAAEFGRATGGVINATTKQGTNDLFINLHVDWDPRGLRSHIPNRGLATAPSDIGRMRNSDTKQLTVEAGGAIIPDHLFVYGLVEPQRNTYESATGSGGTAANRSTFTRTKSNDPFWGGKVDAYITPTQHAEFTIFDTRSTETQTNYNFTPNADFTGGTIGSVKGIQSIKTGGLNWVARYTGDVTDFLTLSGAYGVSKDAGDFVPSDPNAYYVTDIRSGATNVLSQQSFPAINIDDTKRRFYRADADIRFTAAGQHHLRVGFDNEDLSELKTTNATGTMPINYQYNAAGILFTYEHLGGHVSGNDTAFYIEDSWNTPLSGFTLNIGLRDDIFRQSNLSGERYLDFKNNLGPRIAFNYTPPALENWKFFGSYGRYFIPPAMNLGFRGKDLYFQEQFDYPATLVIDPTTGLPSALGAAQPGSAGNSNCPIPLTGAPGNPVNAPGACAVYGGGIQNPAIAKVVPGTKATYEDEFVLGARYQANHLLSFGIQATYRKLGRVSEDTDFAPQLAAYWCSTAHYDKDRCSFYSNNSSYMIWNVNPTSSLVVNDWIAAGNGQTLPITLTTGMHFPKPKRTYEAVVLDFNRADDGHWMASGSATWSRLRGSTEGTVKSDAGNGAQTDAGSTEDFDYLGLADYEYGRLPNDHTWQFKLFGAYHFGKLLTLGANVFVQSPMSGSCLGYHPFYPQPDVLDLSAYYGSVSHFCGSGPLNAKGYYTQTSPAPRGTGWKSDWLKQVDLSGRFNIPLGNTDARKIVFRVDVFNVFDSHAVIQRYARHENARSTRRSTCGTGVSECWRPNPLYLTPLFYQDPRYVRLGLDILWGGHGALPPAPPPPPSPPPPPPAPTRTCADGSVILATATCPVPPPPAPPPPPPAPERGQ